MSVASMWECNSVSVEIELQGKYLSLIEEQGIRQVENILITKEIKKSIYDTNLLIYSHIVHPISKNIVGNGELQSSYYISKLLATLSLNLPDRYYGKIRLPEFLKNYASNENIINFIKNKDANFIYNCLWMNMQEVFGNFINFESNSISEIINLILECSDLPKEEVIFNEVLDDFLSIRNMIETGHYSDKYKDIMKFGENIFKKRGLFSRLYVQNNDYSYLRELPIICNDEEEHSYFDWEIEMIDIENRIEEFVKACGV